jgi:hypothetical protein
MLCFINAILLPVCTIRTTSPSLLKDRIQQQSAIAAPSCLTEYGIISKKYAGSIRDNRHFLKWFL